MDKFKILFVFLLLFISVSAVHADGNFTSLQTEIDNAENSVELTQDYVYDDESDYGLTEGISIEKSNFVVNGNGHVIDAKGHSRIFNVTGDNVTFLNLNLINGNDDFIVGGILGFNMTLNNITFINNTGGYGGALMGESIILDNCTFKKNHGEMGAAINALKTLNITNSVFQESYDIKSSLIYGSPETVLLVENCTFLNSTSKYATAIYNMNSTKIRNSIFKNLHSTESAGAIGFKEMIEAVIENCVFINTTATKNAGALFLDVCGGSEYDGEVFIINSTFINSSGDYGGAIMQLGGNLTIVDSDFIGNSAVYDGSAMYISSTTTSIVNTTFVSNKITNDFNEGAALYIDNSWFNITDSYLENNMDNAIYTYQTSSNLNNITFKNNTLAIHGVFSEFEYNNIILGNDTLFLNDTFYGSIIREPYYDIKILNNSINVNELPSRFDSREWGWITPVKNQGTRGACWAFGICAAVEAAILKATGIEYDFSENNMQNILLQYSKSGIWGLYEGGFHEISSQYLTSWLGIFSEEYDTYDELGKVSPPLLEYGTIHIQDLIFIEPRKNSLDNDNIKKAIMECGAVSVGIKVDEQCYNPQTAAQYQNNVNYTDHDICIVGWDDNYSKDNFLNTPPGDGAFIIKNSWGEYFGIDGYMYVSYYDTSLLNDSYGIAILINNSEKYITNYQNDFAGMLYFDENENNTNISYKTTYEAVANDILSAVGTYFSQKGENFTIELYINDELKHTQNGSAPFYGFHTIKLTEEFPVKIGDNFTVVMTKKTLPLLSDSRLLCPENITFINEGDGWVNLPENETTSLKVYAKTFPIITMDMTKIYKNDTDFIAIVHGVNETVTFEINGKQYNRTTDEYGLAKLAINLIPNEYTIKTTFNSMSIENKINILPTLQAENLIKFFRNSSQFYISLINGEGKCVSGVNITMNINGVFYNRTTNENGTAKLNINLNPGVYILTATDPFTGLKMSYSITVLPTLTGENITMIYLDGTQFKATLINSEGKHVSGVNITFNINGVFYNRTTDENGVAKLNIRLIAGEYIITSQYDEAITSNIITIY